MDFFWVVLRYSIPVAIACILTYLVFPKISELFGSIIDTSKKMWISASILFVGKLALHFSNTLLIKIFGTDSWFPWSAWSFITAALNVVLFYIIVRYILKADPGEAIPLTLITYATYSIMYGLFVLRIYRFVLGTWV